MLGLEAIDHYGGWNWALVGSTIVFVGLILLSLAVSQIHKLLALWENRGANRHPAEAGSPAPNNPVEVVLPRDVASSIKQLKLLTERIGLPFSLPKLLDLSEKTGIGRSHAMTNAALEAGIIIPDGKGYFTWDQTAFDKKVNG